MSARIRTIIKPVNKGPVASRLNQYLKEVTLEEPAVTVSFLIGGIGVVLTWMSMPNVRGLIVPYKTPKISWFGEHW